MNAKNSWATSPERESKVERYLRDQVKVKLVDSECYKFTSPGRINVPDRIIIGHSLIAFVEVKGTGGRLKPGQARELKRLRERGHIALVLWSREEVDYFITALRGVQYEKAGQRPYIQNFEKHSRYKFDYGEGALAKGVTLPEAGSEVDL